ncbi:hypothetical protein ABZW18_31890 [Streptomyces sp. NPDC004647]|uniref:hypothetical protein n=1 Tax=Streptomyces sp. NPDC004647 TaxID=3154671 RepID=UPI0033B6D639
MTERPTEAPPEHREGVPRDMQDQQASSEETPDRWDVEEASSEEEPPEPEELPDTDVAGTGRRGAPAPEGVDPDQPAPEEPTD